MEIVGFESQLYEKQINIIYNYSMIVQPDEVMSNRFFQMQFVEFLEALARLADKISPMSHKEVFSKQQEDETWEQRHERPIEQKLEIFLLMIKEKILDKTLDKFRLKRKTINQFSEKISALRVVNRLRGQIGAFHQMQNEIKYIDQQQKECLAALDY